MTEESGTSLRTAVRMIAALYPTVGKPAVQGEIKEMKLEPVATEKGTRWKLAVIMENSGLIVYRAIGEVQVVDSNGTTIETVKVPTFPVLPKRQQRLVALVNNLSAPGSYTFRARVEVDGEIQEASAVLTAKEPEKNKAPEAGTQAAPQEPSLPRPVTPVPADQVPEPR